MNKFLIALVMALGVSMPMYAAEDAKPKTKKVCVDQQGKDGKSIIDHKTQKPKQNCREVKIREKHEGTAVPEKKK